MAGEFRFPSCHLRLRSPPNRAAATIVNLEVGSSRCRPTSTYLRSTNGCLHPLHKGSRLPACRLRRTAQPHGESGRRPSRSHRARKAHWSGAILSTHPRYATPRCHRGPLYRSPQDPDCALRKPLVLVAPDQKRCLPQCVLTDNLLVTHRLIDGGPYASRRPFRLLG